MTVQTKRKASRGWIPTFLPCAFLLAALPLQAEEIAPYKLTGVDGYVGMQYLSDEQTNAQPGLPRTRQAQSGWREEIYATTHSYVYHPNLMTLDIGGGPIFNRTNFDDDTGSTTARGSLYNFSARANLLRDKPYNGDLFFSHLNPTVSLSPGQVMTQENRRYGFDVSLLAPVTPLPVQLGFVRSDTQGRGAGRVMDEHVDQLNLSATRSFGALGYTQAQYQSSQQASKSGSVDLPLQSSSSEQKALNLYTGLQLGDDRKYDLTNAININEQKYMLETGAPSTLKDMRFMLDGRARHSEQLHTSGFFSYGHSTQGALDTRTRSMSAGLSYWPSKNTEGNLGLRAEDNRTALFQSRTTGVDASIRREQELPLGTLQASYGVRANLSEQFSAAAETPVVGERIALTGSDYLPLSHDHVVTASPIVSNADRTQTFVSGVDYSLEVVGNETRLRRLVGGRILDGEQLLVDYSYDNGSTYASRQLDQTVSLNWNLSRNSSFYFRGLTSNSRLTSGQSIFPLNQVRSHTYGAKSDHAFNPGLSLTAGGNFEREDRRETIAPYRRASFELYLQSEEPVLGSGYLRMSTRRSRIDYALAQQNSNLVGYELRYWVNQWHGLNLNATLGMERDSAGLLPRQRQDFSLGSTWQVRKFLMSTSLLMTRESQGEVQRRRAMLQMQARRDF